MKIFFFVSAIFASAVFLSAADLQLTDGRVFKDATITGQSATNVTVRHAGGLTSVAKAALPEALCSQYPITSAAPSSTIKRDPRAEEQARIARAKAAREARAQWLKDNPQAHQITYRVESRTPSTMLTTATPEKGVKTFCMQADGFGKWEQTFTAMDGFQLQLGCEALTHKFAETATLVILVDGSEVRREMLEPKSGSLEISWELGKVESEQLPVIRSADFYNGANDGSDASGIANARGSGHLISEKHTAGWTATRN